MNHPISNASTEEEEKTTKLNLFGSVSSDAMVLGGMLALAYLGVAITYVNRNLSHLYWLTMVPVFGTICFVLQWLRARSTEVNRIRLLGTQLLHWGGLFTAVELAYALLTAGGIPRATTGMVTLLLFTLATFLYGVHLDRRFIVVGGFLGISYVVMIYLAAYMWVVLLIAALTVIAAVFIMKRVYSKDSAPL
ncbi:MAG: hypothetical protein ACREVH_03245 [Gammaproteobacteria bacterium]